MAIKNAFKGGTDWADGDILFALDINETFNAFYTQAYTDNTGGSIDNSTTETDLATLTIPQNDFGSSMSVLVTSGFRFKDNNNTLTRSSTFRLYVDGSVVKTIILTEGTADGGNAAGTFTHFATALDSTAANIIVKVSAQNATAVNGSTSFCDGLTVLGINNNS